MPSDIRNRVPEGVPTGGEFAQNMRTEPDLGPEVREDRMDVEVTPALGEWSEIDHDDDAYDEVTVRRHPEIPGYYRATAEIRQDFTQLPLSSDFTAASDEDKATYLNNRHELIEGYFAGRYGDTLQEGMDWSAQFHTVDADFDHAPTPAEVDETLARTRASTIRQDFSNPLMGANADLQRIVAEHDAKPLPPIEVTEAQKDRVFQGFCSVQLELDRDYWLEQSPEVDNPEAEADRLFSPENISPKTRDDLRSTFDAWLGKHSGDVDARHPGVVNDQAGMEGIGEDMCLSRFGAGGFYSGSESLEEKVVANRLAESKLMRSDGRELSEKGFIVGDDGRLYWE